MSKSVRLPLFAVSLFINYLRALERLSQHGRTIFHHRLIAENGASGPRKSDPSYPSRRDTVIGGKIVGEAEAGFFFQWADEK